MSIASGEFTHRMANGAASADKLKVYELIQRMLNFSLVNRFDEHTQTSEYNQCFAFVSNRNKP